MSGRFKSFVVLAGMRTGSNFLEANLNALPGVVSHGEVFNPHFIGKKDQLALFGMDLAARAADPLVLLRRLREETTGLPGFRFFHDHDPRVFDAVMADAQCAKIVLTRNPVETYISWKIAQKTGQWKLTQARNRKQALVHFDLQEFDRHQSDAQVFHQAIQRQLQLAGQTAFQLDYGDLQDLDVLNGLVAFLGVAARLEALDKTLKKQNPEGVLAHVENPAEMEAALARTHPFDLQATPTLEQRRAPMVPGFVAAGGAGLLYLPVRGGPEDAVIDWLSRLGSGGVLGDFSQKSLRQWKRDQVAQRSFTVVRHPVARAWSVYCSQILDEGLPDIRKVMKQTYKMTLPDGAETDAGTLRAGFLDFLRFAKMNLAGQTGLRVPPHWASQIAILQAFGQVQIPDVVLREDRLEAGLAWLAAEVGVAMVPFVATPRQGRLPLARIYDAQVEKAAQDAWPRDYLGFGFAGWRPQV
jgi:LPS sulfotransferase NodH